MIDFLETKIIDKNDITCHSGGADGSDFYFETIGEEFGVKTFAYSYKTKYHKSKNKIEISDEDYKEGVNQIILANKLLSRYGIQKYMNLLARNWAQVKYSTQTFAIGYIVESGKKSPKGYYSKSKFQTVDGGTGYAVQMSINNLREVYVFDLNHSKWFKWSYNLLKFLECHSPKINTQNFAGIGTRQITKEGIDAIRELYKNTFN